MESLFSNKVTLHGYMRNVRHSHSINGVDYDKCDLIVKRPDISKEDVIELRFKKFSNPYEEGKEVSLTGNIRSYSHPVEDNKNKVDIYVFTYFDNPVGDALSTNSVILEGRICKKGELRQTSAGKDNIHFIVANNIETANGQKLNSYIPCTAWGSMAKKCLELRVNDLVHVVGELHSREYKKRVTEEDIEIRVAHELFIKEICVDGI